MSARRTSSEFRPVCPLYFVPMDQGLWGVGWHIMGSSACIRKESSPFDLDMMRYVDVIVMTLCPHQNVPRIPRSPRSAQPARCTLIQKPCRTRSSISNPFSIGGTVCR